MKKLTTIFIFTVFVLFSALNAEKIVIDGSTTVGPNSAKAFAGYFKTVNPNVNVSISESGSGNGAKSLINGTCDIADMSRFMKEKEFKQDLFICLQTNILKWDRHFINL